MRWYDFLFASYASLLTNFRVRNANQKAVFIVFLILGILLVIIARAIELSFKTRMMEVISANRPLVYILSIPAHFLLLSYYNRKRMTQITTAFETNHLRGRLKSISIVIPIIEVVLIIVLSNL